MIDWTLGVAAHEQIAAVIRAEIDAGQLEAGNRLQDRDQLGERFDVSHMTVSRALRVLRDEGRIIYRPGRGHFVV